MRECDVTVTLKSITHLENEPLSLLRFEISVGDKKERRTLVISQQKCLELELKKGEISPETFDLIEEEAKKCGAYRRGLGILGYGANSQKNLTVKLRQRGFDRESAEYAAEKLKKDGFIDERSDACRIAEACLYKLWGERRIVAYLAQKGYSGEAVDAAKEMMTAVDFSVNCAKLIKKKGIILPKDKKEASKCIASLQRYGYSLSQIYEAFQK